MADPCARLLPAVPVLLKLAIPKTGPFASCLLPVLSGASVRAACAMGWLCLFQTCVPAIRARGFGSGFRPCFRGDLLANQLPRQANRAFVPARLSFCPARA